VHTKVAHDRCAFCGTLLHKSRRLKKTAAAMVLGLSVTGAQPAEAEPPMVDPAAPAATDLAQCEALDREAEDNPVVDVHDRAGDCYVEVAWTLAWGERRTALAKAVAHYEYAVDLEQAASAPDAARISKLHQKIYQAEAGMEPEPEVHPVYGVPSVPRGACGCGVAPEPPRAGLYGFAALAVLMLARRRR
jgi:MYXO-CTERM domain-containing protein